MITKEFKAMLVAALGSEADGVTRICWEIFAVDWIKVETVSGFFSAFNSMSVAFATMNSASVKIGALKGDIHFL